MIKDIKAAIFDLDGTLIDSMGVWVQIDVDYIKEIGYTDEVNFTKLKNDINHLSFKGTAEYFKKRFDINKSVEEICTRWHEMAYDKYKNEIKLKDGAFDFLHKLKQSGVKIGLATSNSLELSTVCLNANNVLDLFDNITITGEVARGKNYPDVYLLSAQRLGVNPKDAIVFEDILPAIEGAKKGGFKVIRIYDEIAAKTIDENVDVDNSDLLINSYKEIMY